MGKRREGREAAIQYLYFCDLNNVKGTEALKDFWQLRSSDQKPASKSIREFAAAMVRGVNANREALDEKISAYTANYDLNRISTVDRNILRLALYEMFFRDDVPPIVSINEAIEIAKRFGLEESGKFVNGILDRAKKDVTRPHRSAN